MIKTAEMVNAITSAGQTVLPDYGRGITESEKASLTGTNVISLVRLTYDPNDSVAETTVGDISAATIFVMSFSKDRRAAIDAIKDISLLGFLDERMVVQKTAPFSIGTGADEIKFYGWRLLGAYDELVQDIGSSIYMAEQAIEVRFNNRLS